MRRFFLFMFLSISFFCFGSIKKTKKITHSAVLQLYNYDLGQKITRETVQKRLDQKALNPNDYSSYDAHARYYQWDHLRYQKRENFRGPTIHYTGDVLCTARDRAFYGSDFKRFAIMHDEVFEEEWPLFKEKQKDTLSNYIYGEKAQHCDNRLKSIIEAKVNSFTKDYVTLSYASLTHDVANNFLDKHKNIIARSAQGNDELAKILLHGAANVQKQSEKAFIIHAIAYQKYQLLYPYRNQCHQEIQRCIQQSISITENTPKNISPKEAKSNNKNKSNKATLPKKKKSGLQNKSVSKNKTSLRDIKLKNWKEGINLLRTGNGDKGVALLLGNIDYLLSQDTELIKNNDKEFLHGLAKGIIEKNTTLSSVQQNVLYVCGKMRQKLGLKDELGIVEILWNQKTLKGLLLKINDPEFDPSLLCATGESLFTDFYDIPENNEDIIAEKAIAKIVNNFLQSDPYTVYFLLEALPFAKGKYNEEFLQNFFENESNCDKAASYNVIPKEMLFSRAGASFFQNSEKLRGKTGELARCFYTVIQKYARYKPSDEDDGDNAKEFIQAIKDFLLFKRQKNHSKKMEAWIGIFQYAVFRMAMSRLQEYKSDLGGCIEEFELPEFYLRRLFDTSKLCNTSNETESLQKLHYDQKNYYDGLSMLPILRAISADKKGSEFKKELEEYLKRETLKRVFSGPQEYFKLVLDRTRTESVVFLKMRDIILNKSSSLWEEEFEKIQKYIKLDPMICVVLATEVDEDLRLNIVNSDFENDKQKDIKTHFYYVRSLLKMELKRILDSDLMAVLYNLFERSMLSMMYLAETNKHLTPLLKPIVEDILSLAKKLDPRFFAKNNFQQEEQLFISMLAPFDNDFDQFREAGIKFLQHKKKKK